MIRWMGRLLPSVLCLVFVLTLILPVPAHAATTIRVPHDYSTIQAAVDAASPGDSILVASGTYIENVKVNKPVAISGESSSPVVVQAANPEDDVFAITAGNVSLANLTVAGTSGSNMAGVHVSGADNARLQGLRSTGNRIGVFLENTRFTFV